MKTDAAPTTPAPGVDALANAARRAYFGSNRHGYPEFTKLAPASQAVWREVAEAVIAARLAQPAPDAQSATPSTMWRANLHNFLDVAAGEGLVLGGVDAADLYVAVFPDEYKAACDPLAPAPSQPQAATTPQARGEAKDAARYRWLRDPANQEGAQFVEISTPDELDAAVDAAIASAKDKP